MFKMAKKEIVNKMLIKFRRFWAMLYLMLPVKNKSQAPRMRVIYRKRKT